MFLFKPEIWKLILKFTMLIEFLGSHFILNLVKNLLLFWVRLKCFLIGLQCLLSLLRLFNWLKLCCWKVLLILWETFFLIVCWFYWLLILNCITIRNYNFLNFAMFFFNSWNCSFFFSFFNFFFNCIFFFAYTVFFSIAEIILKLE